MSGYLETIRRMKASNTASPSVKDGETTCEITPSHSEHDSQETQPVEYELNERNELTPSAPLGGLHRINPRNPEIIRYSYESTWFDLPFPLGFGGLPRAQVEIAEVVNARLGITDPVLRKYNVISHVHSYYQDLSLNDGRDYEALKLEQERLGQILNEGGW